MHVCLWHLWKSFSETCLSLQKSISVVSLKGLHLESLKVLPPQPPMKVLLRLDNLYWRTWPYCALLIVPRSKNSLYSRGLLVLQMMQKISRKVLNVPLRSLTQDLSVIIVQDECNNKVKFPNLNDQLFLHNQFLVSKNHWIRAEANETHDSVQK